MALSGSHIAAFLCILGFVNIATHSQHIAPDHAPQQLRQAHLSSWSPYLHSKIGAKDFERRNGGLNAGGFNQPRLRHRGPRSDPIPSHTEVVLTQLAQQVTQLTAMTSVLSHDLQNVKARNMDLQQEMVALRLNNTQLSATLSLQETRILQQARDAANTLTSRVRDLETQLKTMEQNQSDTAGITGERFLGLSRRLEKLELAQKNVESRLAIQSSSLSLLTQVSFSTEAKVSNLSTNLSNINTTVNDIILHQNSISESVHLQESRLEKLGQRMTSAETKAEQMASKTQDLVTWRDDISNDVRLLNVTQSGLVSDVGSAGEGVHALTAETRGLQDQVSHLDHKISYSATSVLFYASLKEDQEWPQPHPPHPVKLDVVLANQGQAYNVTSGLFTAPLDGDYFLAGSGKDDWLELRVDNASVVGGTSFEVAVSLRAGQEACVSPTWATRFKRGTSFNGFLIKPRLNNLTLTGFT